MIKDRGQVTLYSRNGNVLNKKFPYVTDALMGLPDGTILDGELVALDKEGKPNFGLLQNFRSAASQIHFYPFDVLICLVERRHLFLWVTSKAKDEIREHCFR